MTARQIVEEFKNLSPEEKAEAWTLLQQQMEAANQSEIRFLPQDQAKQISRKLFVEYDDLFRKLAK